MRIDSVEGMTKAAATPTTARAVMTTVVPGGIAALRSTASDPSSD